MARSGEAPGAELRRRTVSAVLIAVPAVLAIWFGGIAFHVLVVLGGLVMAVEWHRVIHGGIGAQAQSVPLWLALPPALVLAATGLWPVALWLLAAAFLWSAVAGLIERNRDTLLRAAGILWIGLPCVALLWLRDAGPEGRATVLWLVAVVAATDIGGYTLGRAVGGPKLAPRISPGKTWAGLFGAMAGAALVGVATAAIAGGGRIWPLAVAGAVLAVVAQAGDLMESAVKRRYGVKDMGSVLPGHGGIFDRVDGLVVAVVATALAGLFVDGGVLAWR